MNRFLKFAIWSLGVVFLLGLYFFDNIRGYFRFKEICANDAGLRVYQPLERNVGWTIGAGGIANTAFIVQFVDVAFVRYKNEGDGNLYDVYKKARLKTDDLGYAQQASDASKSAIYQYSVETIDLPNETRTGAQHFYVVDLRTKKQAIRYSRFSYSKFNPGNTILGAGSGEFCPEDFARTDLKTGKSIPSKMFEAFASSFAK